MSKRIALTDYVEVDGVDISNLVLQVGFESTDDQVDVSGFNPAGSSEFLQGNRVREITLEVFGSRAANEIHQVLWPIHDGRLTATFKWRADSNAGVSATNEELRGNIKILNYAEGGTRGDAETATITLVQASATVNPLTFYST
jgi:hypothetical protein